MSIEELEIEFTRLTNRHIARALKPLDNIPSIPYSVKKEISGEIWNLKDDIISALKISKSSKGDSDVQGIYKAVA